MQTTLCINVDANTRAICKCRIYSFTLQYWSVENMDIHITLPSNTVVHVNELLRFLGHPTSVKTFIYYLLFSYYLLLVINL